MESRSLLVSDDDAIPPSRQYIHRHACGEAHPGLCATADSDVYSNALVMARSFEACLTADMVGRFICVQGVHHPFRDGDEGRIEVSTPKAFMRDSRNPLFGADDEGCYPPSWWKLAEGRRKQKTAAMAGGGQRKPAEGRRKGGGSRPATPKRWQHVWLQGFRNPSYK